MPGRSARFSLKPRKRSPLQTFRIEPALERRSRRRLSGHRTRSRASRSEALAVDCVNLRRHFSCICIFFTKIRGLDWKSGPCLAPVLSPPQAVALRDSRHDGTVAPNWRKGGGIGGAHAVPVRGHRVAVWVSAVCVYLRALAIRIDLISFHFTNRLSLAVLGSGSAVRVNRSRLLTKNAQG